MQNTLIKHFITQYNYYLVTMILAKAKALSGKNIHSCLCLKRPFLLTKDVTANETIVGVMLTAQFLKFFIWLARDTIGTTLSPHFARKHPII